MNAEPLNPEPLPFEDALARLENLVAQMESGKLSLDDTMQRFAEGMALAEICTRKLTETEKKIEILLKRNAAGNARWRDFDPGTSQSAAPPAEEASGP